TDASNLVDSLSITSGAGALGAVTVTGDLDSFNGADGDYASLQVTAVVGDLKIANASLTTTISSSAALDLSYDPASDLLAIEDYTNGGTVTVSDASGMVDEIRITASGTKMLGALRVDGDLDRFVASSASAFSTLEVTAATGVGASGLWISAGTDVNLIEIDSGTLSLTYASSAIAGSGAEIRTLTTSGTTTTSSLSITDLAGADLRITSIVAPGPLGDIQSNGIVQDMQLQDHARRIQVGDLSGKISLENQVKALSPSAPLLSLTVGADTLNIDVSRQDSVVSFDVVSAGQLELRFRSNSTDSNHLTVQDPGSLLGCIVFRLGMRPVFENVTVTGPSAAELCIIREEFGAIRFELPGREPLGERVGLRSFERVSQDLSPFTLSRITPVHARELVSIGTAVGEDELHEPDGLDTEAQQIPKPSEAEGGEQGSGSPEKSEQEEGADQEGQQEREPDPERAAEQGSGQASRENPEKER
ncbi:MAG: hypothetical protein ACE5F1_11775, partial [Planctomycetota bacterium]